MNNENQSSTVSNNKKHNPWRVSALLLGLVAAVLAVGVAYTYVLMQQSQDDVKSLTKQLDTLRAGLGKSNNNAQTNNNDEDAVSGATNYKSKKGLDVVVAVAIPALASTDSSSPRTLTVTGKVPGSWSNEGQFNLKLHDSKDKIVASGVATLSGDWQTDKLVDFTATLTTVSVPAGDYTLVLEKANPSDLAANADNVEIAIKLD